MGRLGYGSSGSGQTYRVWGVCVKICDFLVGQEMGCYNENLGNTTPPFLLRVLPLVLEDPSDM